MKTLEQINKKISAVFGKQKILKIQNRAVRELKPKEIQATIKIGNLVQVDTSLGAMIIELSRLEKYLAYAKAEKATLWNFYSLYGACPHDWNDALWKVERALNLLKTIPAPITASVALTLILAIWKPGPAVAQPIPRYSVTGSVTWPSRIPA